MPFHEKGPIETFSLYEEIRDVMTPTKEDFHLVIVDLRPERERDDAKDGIPSKYFFGPDTVAIHSLPLSVL